MAAAAFLVSSAPHEEKLSVQPVAGMARMVLCQQGPHGQQQEAWREISLIQSLDETNLSALQNSMKAVSIDTA